MKRYCKNCKFIQPWRIYCEPYVPVGIRFDDYHGPKHLIRRTELGRFRREEQNAKNDCRLYLKKWWKFWIK